MILNPKDIKLQYYVLNYDPNAHKVVHFNIYRNWLLNDHTVAEIRKHLRNKKKYPFEKFVQEVRSLIRWQEWSRCEYEISVGDAFEEDVNKLEKWDCYKQAEPNVEMIAREIIYQYKQQLKATKM
jgi:hypothetical protein